MDWTLEDYRTWGAADDKIVLGVPMYGREALGSSDAVPGTATGDATSLTVENAIARAAGYPYRFDDTSQTAWAFTEVGQLWYDDYATLETKLTWSVDQGIQGVGYWALGYDGNDPAFWAMVDRVTLIPSEGDTAEPDTGSVDTGTAESGELDSGDLPPTEADDDTAVGEDEKASGCSCAVSILARWAGWLCPCLA